MLIINTSTIGQVKREEIATREQWSECEDCGCTNSLLTRDAEGKYIKFYKKHLMVLCDECVDRRNGNAWVDEQGQEIPRREHRSDIKIAWQGLRSEREQEIYASAFWGGVGAGENMKIEMMEIERGWNIGRQGKGLQVAVQRNPDKVYDGRSLY